MHPLGLPVSFNVKLTSALAASEASEKIVLVRSSAFCAFFQFFLGFFPLSPVESVVDFIVTNGIMIL